MVHSTVPNTPTRDISTPIIQTSAKGVPTPTSPAPARHITDLNPQTSVEDVPVSQVPANDIPGARSLVDVHTSQPRLGSPDPIAFDVTPRQFMRFFQNTLSTEECCEHDNRLVFFVGRKQYSRLD